MWAFLHQDRNSHDGSGSNELCKGIGINIDKMMLSIIMSTWLAAVGILMYEQGFSSSSSANSAVLRSGACGVCHPDWRRVAVNKASITNVIIGTFLFQGIVTMTPSGNEFHDSWI